MTILTIGSTLSQVPLTTYATLNPKEVLSSYTQMSKIDETNASLSKENI